MSKGERATRILTISLSPSLYEEIEAAAQEERRTKSELIREAFRQYQFSRRWTLIRQWGAESAARLGVSSDEDLERLLG